MSDPVRDGGIGKTRLALEVVSQELLRFEAVWFVELSGAMSAAEVASRVMATLLPNCPVGEHPFELLATELGEGRHLLVLDSCERQLESCAVLADGMIRRCRGLEILATSQGPLSIEGEVVYRLGPLREDDGAVELFVDRGRAAARGSRWTRRLSDGFATCWTGSLSRSSWRRHG